MWTRVEGVIEDVRPLIRSVGMDVEVDDVIDQVVTLKLSRLEDAAAPDLVRLRDFVTRELKSELPDVKDVVFVQPDAPPVPPAWTVTTPEPDSETVVMSFQADVAPPGTSMFEGPDEATDWPVIAAVLRIPGVETVMGRAKMLVIARSDNAAWDDILGAMESYIGPEAVRPEPAGDLTARVQEVLEAEINPGVASHGGRIELVEMQGTEAMIRMTGGCQGCAQSTATLRMGVEQALLRSVPEVTKVTDVTDHTSGSNPFFQR